MYAIRMILMIDNHNYNYSKPRYSIPLVEQRYHGVFPYNPNLGCAWRFIHNHLDGAYLPGRHHSRHGYIIYDYPSFILKFYFSPWNEQSKAKKITNYTYPFKRVFKWDFKHITVNLLKYWTYVFRA